MSSIQQALQTLGTDISSVFGGGNQGFTQFGSVNPTQQMGINAALQQNPSLAGLQGQVAGVGPMMQGPATPTGGTQTGATPTSQSPVNMGALGQMYMRYLIAKRLQQRSAPGFSVPSAQQPPFNPFGATPGPGLIAPPQVQL